MSSYKVCVYAICKNEAQFVQRWMDSMGEADGVYVLDTGSDDGTPQRLEELGAVVQTEEITPWRFDKARNRSLELVPEDADICVCTDLDEVFRPGWRQAVEDVWDPENNQLHYRYIWSFLPDGREGINFWGNKMHSRKGCRWVGAVHEVLRFDEGEGPAVYAGDVVLEHHPDHSKPRSQYLPLLEKAVEEEPDNDRNVHYLGREYYFYQRWAESMATLKRHLSLPTATWADERCASMRLLAKDCLALDREKEAEQWMLRAIGEAPHLREPWLDLADLCRQREEWQGVLWLTNRALAIQERPRTYISEPAAWGEAPWDLASLGYYYTGKLEEALTAAETALSLAPQDRRIQENVVLIRAEVNRTRKRRASW